MFRRSLLVLLIWMGISHAQTLPQGFVYVDEVIPDVVLEMRYYTQENFLGTRVDGYHAPRAILSRAATYALQGVQNDLKAFHLGIKIYDAYRPQRAVDHFVRWAHDLNDTRMRAHYYPDVPKEKLFEEGYIATRSGHTRGSTLDLTLIDLQTHEELDMGSPFDFFGPCSWPSDPTITPAQRAHRMLLQTLMKQHGFVPYDQEWWHFRLDKEPFPTTYFDFPIE